MMEKPKMGKGMGKGSVELKSPMMAGVQGREALVAVGRNPHFSGGVGSPLNPAGMGKKKKEHGY